MKTTLSLMMMSAGIVFAVSAAAKLPDEGQQFPNTTVWSVAGLCVAAVGVGGWRLANRAAEAPGVGATRRRSDPLAGVRKLQTALSTLCDRAGTLGGAQMRHEIDQILDQLVLPFTQSRYAVIQQLGMHAGAELLIEFALGERLLNRAWSAAADGNLTEARSSLAAAQQAFAELVVP